MNTKEAIQTAGNIAQMVLMSYVGDLDDADLMKRPADGCNHLAWQLGHLISSETMLLEGICPGKGIELPEGFHEAYRRDTQCSDDVAHFKSKAEYVELFEKVRAASLAALEEMDDAKLDEPNPIQSMSEMLPTVGQMFTMMLSHPLMHAGQFVPVRRNLGKPVVI